MKKLQEIKGPMTGQEVLEDVTYSLLFNTVELGERSEQTQDKIKTLMGYSKERLALHMALMPLVWERWLGADDETAKKVESLTSEAYKVANPPDMGKRMTFV